MESPEELHEPIPVSSSPPVDLPSIQPTQSSIIPANLSEILNERSWLIAPFLIAVIAVLVLILSQRKSKSKKNSLLLVGAPDAGKTTILSELVYGQHYNTHTSIQVNSALLETSKRGQYVKIIDIPGHPRVRDQFREHLAETKALAFVVDSHSLSRNSAAVAEHLHSILHAITTLPPSVTPPGLLILAHKCDLVKVQGATSVGEVAINKVKVILERELEKRRASQSSGQAIDGLGAEGDETELGGLECSGPSGTFKFADWDGGEIVFLATSVPSGGELSEKNVESGCADLIQWIGENCS